jgi:hypothetical protein
LIAVFSADFVLKFGSTYMMFAPFLCDVPRMAVFGAFFQ